MLLTFYPVIVFFMALDNAYKIADNKPIKHVQKMIILVSVVWPLIAFSVHNMTYYESVFYTIMLLWSTHWFWFDLFLNILRPDKKWNYVGNSFFTDKIFNFEGGFMIQSLAKGAIIGYSLIKLMENYPHHLMPWN